MGHVRYNLAVAFLFRHRLSNSASDLRVVFAFVASLFLISSCQTQSAELNKRSTVSNRASEIPAIQNRQPLQLPLRDPKIVVHKARRELLLFAGNTIVRTYRAGLGLSPIGDKVRQGDRRTPEGEFYIFTRNKQSQFYLSLGISYPNATHAKRGLRDGLINRAQYDSIMSALEKKKRPLQNTALGGDIYIHGNGASSDWTWGCVALENEDMRELFDAVPVGTPVTIEP